MTLDVDLSVRKKIMAFSSWQLLSLGPGSQTKLAFLE